MRAIWKYLPVLVLTCTWGPLRILSNKMRKNTKTLGVTKHNYKGDYLLWQGLTVCKKNATDLPSTAYQMATSPLPPPPELVSFSFGFFNSPPTPESNLLMENLCILCGLQIWHPNPNPKNKIFSWGTLWKIQLCTWRLPSRSQLFRVPSTSANRGQMKRSTALLCSYTQDSELNTIVDSFIFSKARFNVMGMAIVTFSAIMNGKKVIIWHFCDLFSNYELQKVTI